MFWRIGNLLAFWQHEHSSIGSATKRQPKDFSGSRDFEKKKKEKGRGGTRKKLVTGGGRVAGGGEVF